MDIENIKNEEVKQWQKKCFDIQAEKLQEINQVKNKLDENSKVYGEVDIERK